MADETKQDDEQAAEEVKPKKSKKGLLLGGGILGLVGGAYLLATLAIPAAPQHIPFKGPFSVDLQATELQVNLASDGGTRFLVMTLRAEVYSYEATYPTARVADPLYVAILQDALIGVCRTKSRVELEDVVGAELLRRELLEAIRPILFPLHVGDPVNPYAPDTKSGLHSGDSHALGTYRRGFEDGVLTVDATAKTVQLDDGPPVSFEGMETDLQVPDANGLFVYLNVAQLKPGFQGMVKVGTFGRISKLFFGKFITQ